MQSTQLEGWYQQFNSLADYYEHFCQRYTNQEAFVQFGSTITYGHVWEIAQKFACFLQQKNIQKGDRVAILLPNCMPYPACIIAAHLVGAVVVNLNPEYTTYELEIRLKDAAPSAIVVLDCFAAKIEEVLKTVKISTAVVVSIGDLLPSWKRIGVQAFLHITRQIPAYQSNLFIKFRSTLLHIDLNKITIEKTDLAFLQYTGGTTGTIKAAMLSHGNLLANLEQTRLLFGDFLKEGQEINVFALPMYHIFSLTVNFLLSMGLGVKHIMIVDPRRLSSLIKDVSRFPITMMIGVNTLFDKLMLHPKFSSLNLAHLKLVVAGGMAVQETVARKWQTLTKVPILEGYGLTETSPVVSMNDLTNHDYNGSIGKPVFATEIKFLDDQHNVVAEGEIGELAVRGPQVMSGYWHQTEETKAVFTEDHYFMTGDMAYRDSQGFLFLKERKKDMIDISGLKVYPSEVEDVLLEQPHVLEAAVIGEKTTSGHEMVVAYVVRDSERLLEQELIHACKKKLTSYKIPKKIYFCDSLPKSNVGKILKRELRNLNGKDKS
ncbi:MAG: AMP-binding protein [Pseudomonadota bacterium]